MSAIAELLFYFRMRLTGFSFLKIPKAMPRPEEPRPRTGVAEPSRTYATIILAFLGPSPTIH